MTVPATSEVVVFEIQRINSLVINHLLQLITFSFLSIGKLLRHDFLSLISRVLSVAEFVQQKKTE